MCGGERHRTIARVRAPAWPQSPGPHLFPSNRTHSLRTFPHSPRTPLSTRLSICASAGTIPSRTKLRARRESLRYACTWNSTAQHSTALTVCLEANARARNLLSCHKGTGCRKNGLKRASAHPGGRVHVDDGQQRIAATALATLSGASGRTRTPLPRAIFADAVRARVRARPCRARCAPPVVCARCGPFGCEAHPPVPSWVKRWERVLRLCGNVAVPVWRGSGE